MSKKRKTKKEKIIAELRHKLASGQIKNSPSSSKIDDFKKEENKEENKFSYSFSSQNNKEQPKEITISKNYVSKDLLKTGLLTGAILLSELLLFFLLKNKFIEIPNLSF